ncbi:MAG TPA: hypothetical protein VJB70_01375 [Candidatus Paceibacterota bacterium]
MDGGLILGLGIMAFAVFLIFATGFLTSQEAGVSVPGFLCFGVVLLVLLAGAELAARWNMGTISEDNVFSQPDLVVGIPYEHLGSVQHGERFVAVIKKQGASEPLAYFFPEKLPEGFFLKIKEGKVYKYVPYVSRLQEAQ